MRPASNGSRCYYTSDVERGYPWILGMVLPSSIRMAKVDLPSLETLVEVRTACRS